MKNILKITFVLLFSSMNSFSQDSGKPEHINIKKTLNQLFLKTKINSSGNLCLTMSSFGERFNMRIDNNKEPIISVYNETYCIRDSIKIVNKGGLYISLVRNKNNYWDGKKNIRTPFRSDIKKYEGAIETVDDSIIDMPIEKYKLLKEKK
ncbi:MAG: hypothetical protein V4497_12485 [Bacteroidota bacterium]